MEDYSLEDLYDTKRYLENKIENFFGGEQVYHGDRGYQDLLCDLDEVDEEIESRENNN